jgi:tetratricopeptide (TPR) repeat protein
LKTSNKHIIVFGALFTLLACSTKRDNFANRNFQALNTKYNVLYNGGVALDKGLTSLKTQYKDDYWDILPIERQQIVALSGNDETQSKPKNADFDRAEEKATKAIQRRSMNIDGTERNPQIDEAYLMLGQARYYDQRFIPALEAFNYILYKYPKSDKIYTAKIWREKTNMRLENDALAVQNLTSLLKEIKLKDQVFSDANAILAQAYLKTDQRDSAISKLKTAIKFSKKNEEKARYRFILGQIFEQKNQVDSAKVAFQTVIDMKRKSPRNYVVESQLRLAGQFDFQTGDTVLFMKNYNKIMLDRENRPFLDVINHRLALNYDKNKNNRQAKKYYNKSLRCQSENEYLKASNYRNLASIYFYEAKYVNAGKYYDSTLVKLKPRTREFNTIKKKRENLEDVIKYEGIAQTNDSILNLISMSDSQRNTFFENYITKLKKEEEIQKKLAEKAKIIADNAAIKSDLSVTSDQTSSLSKDQNYPQKGFTPPSSISNQNTFYFYNPQTVAFGRVEFRKNWGDRKLKENWRNSVLASNDENSGQNIDVADNSDANLVKSESEKYTTKYYINQLPKKQEEIYKLKIDRNFAYFQLGTIYKEKFLEYKLAQAKLEALLNLNPEERLVLPSMYNLFKIYEITNQSDKAIAMKNAIIEKYPNSRYAQILQNKIEVAASNGASDVAYLNLFQQYNIGNYRQVLPEFEKAIEQFTGDEIVPKIEILKANVIGKTKGLAEFKKALNYVSLTYPNSLEGKRAEEMLGKDIPSMEALQFNSEKPLSWKMLYKFQEGEAKTLKPFQEKLDKFLKERNSPRLFMTLDLYTLDSNFVVIHGLISEQEAKDINSILKEYKVYLIQEPAIIISSNNYKIVQIKKNLEEYLADPNKVATSSSAVIPPVSNGQKLSPKDMEAEKKLNEIIKNNQKSINPPGFSAEPALELKEDAIKPKK